MKKNVTQLGKYTAEKSVWMNCVFYLLSIAESDLRNPEQDGTNDFSGSTELLGANGLTWVSAYRGVYDVKDNNARNIPRNHMALVTIQIYCSFWYFVLLILVLKGSCKMLPWPFSLISVKSFSCFIYNV